MLTFTTKTGLGYIREDATGNIVARCDLPPVKKLPDTVDEKNKVIPGEVVPEVHWIKDGYTFVEAANKAELDAVIVYAPPVIKIAAELIEEKIRAEIKAMAEERLKARGEI